MMLNINIWWNENVLNNYNNHTIWFAGEKKQANSVRDHVKKASFDTKNLRISSFWTI